MANDTPTAILTKGQREYLRGEKTPTQERTMRTRIRERLRVGISDFELLLENLPAEEIEDAFGEDVTGIADAFGVLYLAAEAGTGKSPAVSPIGAYELLIERGVKKALNRLGVVVEEIDVSISVTEQTAEKTLEEMTVGELAQLVGMGEADREELINRIKKGFPEEEAEDRPEQFGAVDESRAEWLADDMTGVESDDAGDE